MKRQLYMQINIILVVSCEVVHNRDDNAAVNLYTYNEDNAKSVNGILIETCGKQVMLDSDSDLGIV